MRPYLIACLILSLANAKEVVGADKPQIHVASKPSWIGIYKTYDKKPSARAIRDGFFYALSDYEINIGAKQSFHHYVREIVSANGIQDGSQISVDFNPSYEKLDFHEVIVWRDSKPQSRLKLSDFKLLADEQDFSKFIYEGTYSANLILSDIRKGDRIEYSYTITGVNPVLDNKFSRFLYLQSDKTITHQYISVVSPVSRKLNMKFFNQASQPKITESQGIRRYVWEDFMVEPVLEADNEPSWYNPYNYVEISEYDNWAEVADWARKVNPPAKDIQGELRNLIDKLKNKYGDDKVGYFRDAVRTVQNDVRYMGIEIGEYSHRANRPEKVYSQRYGDCKDKSLLLVSLLRANGIDANMVLVNTDLKNKTADLIPTASAFNHAVVEAEVNGKKIWIDATIANQGGNGTDIYFPEYSKGLILKAGTVDLSDIPHSRPGLMSCQDVYTVTDDSSKVKLVVKTTYTREQADRQRDRLASSSIAETEKSYLNYYSKIYSKVELADSLKVIDDINKNELTTIETYSVGDFFKPDSVTGKQIADFYADYIGQLLPSISNRGKSPIAVSYPYVINYTTKVVLPSVWNIDEAHNTINRDAYQFNSHYYASADTLFLNYRFVYLKDFVGTNELDEFRKDISGLKEKDGLSYRISYGASATLPFVLNKWLLLGLIGVAAGLCLLAIRIYTRETTGIVFTVGSTFIPIGGWLIIVMIGLAFSSFFHVFELTDKDYLSIAKWNLMTHGGKGFIYRAALIYESIGHIFLGCYAAFCFILMINKRDILPRYIIGYLVAAVLFHLFDYGFAIALKTTDDSDIGTSIVSSIIFAGIWISYFKRSERVEHTFIVPFPSTNYSYEE